MRVMDGEAMPELDATTSAILEQLTAADKEFHDGDAGPRKRLWSHTEPLSLFGAATTKTGWQEISQTFDWLESRFSNCTEFAYEVLAAGSSGDMAYIAGVEHTTASIGGAPPKRYSLRVTTILRRERGHWKVVHRHADPYDEASGAEVSRL